MHVLEVVGGGLRHGDARLARAGERDHGHVGMAHERVAGRLAVAVHDVDDAVREARLVEQLDEALARASGVSSAGFSTTVLPQTSAGASFHDGIAIGKFHGVIAPTTPTGTRTDMLNLSRSSDGVVWPHRRRPSPAM